MNDFDEMRFDLRRKRAMALAAFVMDIVSPYLDGDSRSHRDAYEALFNELYEKGYEVLTDGMRAAAGLPRRDEKGWTPHELAVLEHKRLELLMKPFVVERPLGPEFSKVLEEGLGDGKLYVKSR